MRILLVYDHLDTGGAQTHGLNLSRELIHAGHSVAVASCGGNTAPRFAQQGVQLLTWPAPKRTDLAGLFRAYRSAQALLRDWQPDLIHSHAVLPGVMFSIAARGRSGHRPPIVFTPHRSWRSMYPQPLYQPLIWVLYQVVWQRADYVIAVANGYYQEFIQYGVSPFACFEIPNSVDVSAYDALPTTDPPSASPHLHVVGTVGRLVPQKGLDSFIAAAALVLAQSSDTEFWIIGEGPLHHSLSRQILALGLGDRVKMLGNRADVSALLQQLSVFVSASQWEAVCFAILEALAARRPVVATRVLGSSELVQDGLTGLLVPPDDPAAMSQAILRLLNDPALAHTLGENGRQLVETRYSLQTMTKQVLAVYQHALDYHAQGI
jgi:glycosyltransferase involved in cell wall biosynthesis